MLKHIEDDHEHEKDKVEFEIFVTKSFNKPISRIIDEGLRIKNRDRDTLLNSKSEHYGPSVKRKKNNFDYGCKEKSKKDNNLKKHKDEHSRMKNYNYNN